MQTIEIQIPDNLANFLDKVSLDSYDLKQKIIIEALHDYAQDIIDYKQAEEAIKKNEPTIPLEEIIKKYDL
jgi:predicted DNA-binding protein